MYQRKDYFYKKAKKEGFASRAAYKLTEIQKKYKIIKEGGTVLDLGSAPGGWLQVASKLVGPNGRVVGIDRAPLKIVLPKNALFLQKNIEENVEEQMEWEFDVVLSDISPDISGISFRDTYLSFELARKVLDIAKKLLKREGNLVIKVFPGKEMDDLKTQLKQMFKMLKTYIPKATRKTSSEIYLIGLDRRS